MNKLLYSPFSIIAGIIGSRAGKKAFNKLWSRISDDPKPAVDAPAVPLSRVALSAALEGATMAASAAVAHQLSVRAFHHLFGVWPVKDEPPAA